MMKLTVKGKEYKIKFGYNCFCDTDLMDRVRTMTEMFAGKMDEDPTGVTILNYLFDIVRDLIYVGAKKYNPFESPQDVGDLLDDYIEESPEEKRDIVQLFNQLSEELFNEGFLAGVMEGTPAVSNETKTPSDHKTKK